MCAQHVLTRTVLYIFLVEFATDIQHWWAGTLLVNLSSTPPLSPSVPLENPQRSPVNPTMGLVGWKVCCSLRCSDRTHAAHPTLLHQVRLKRVFSSDYPTAAASPVPASMAPRGISHPPPNKPRLPLLEQSLVHLPQYTYRPCAALAGAGSPARFIPALQRGLACQAPRCAPAKTPPS